ncbi:MAG: MBL fold metallo-hydrolase [Clostridia bacterium]|nr:MBL fold metallo-hydrolase [Clostridia bacterium]
MSIYQIQKIFKDVRGLNEMMVTSFLIEGKGKVLLLDTGMGIFNIKKQAEKLIGNRDYIVVNSHFHPDHSNGNHKFKEIYIGEKDLPTFTKNDVYFKLVDDISSALYKKNPKLRLAMPIINKLLVTKKGKTKYIPLKDGDELDLGNKKFIVKDFPGHTPGSITLLNKEEHYIMMGDACNMGTWMWTNPECNLHDYADTARAYYDDVKADGYKKMRGSHEPFTHKISFIKDYANWIDKLTPEKAILKVNMPGAKSQFCIAVAPSIKHGVYTCFYFAHQCD